MPVSFRTAIFLMLMGLGVQAQHAAGETAGTTPEQDLSRVQQELAASKTRQSGLQSDLQHIATESEAMTTRLVDTAQRIQALEHEQSRAVQHLADLKTESVIIRSDLGARRDVLSELLAGLQRLDRNPPPALVVAPNDILGALRGAIMMGSLVPELDAEARELVTRLERLEAVRLDTIATQNRNRAVLSDLSAAQGEMANLQKQKKALMASQGAALAREKALAGTLASRAATLQALLDGLQKLRTREAAAAAARADETRMREALASQPRLAFASARGRLSWPVQGKLVKHFGDPDGVGGAVKGEFIETAGGAQIVVPADGKVEFAGIFRSYGKLLIIDAGNGYRMVFAGLGKTGVETGQIVRAGEPVATMGTAPTPGTLTETQVHSTSPVLYIEIRKDGDAIDSSPWWIGGLKEARG